MLNDARITAYRERLLSENAELAEEDAQSAEDRGTVMLDQQSVGRLSRMDALQRQAMAEANMRRRAARRARIEAALVRIEEGEFGYCHECGEEIAKARLDLDPTFPSCVSCAKG
jgi:DnaK suppressor protein